MTISRRKKNDQTLQPESELTNQSDPLDLKLLMEPFKEDNGIRRLNLNLSLYSTSNHVSLSTVDMNIFAKQLKVLIDTGASVNRLEDFEELP